MKRPFLSLPDSFKHRFVFTREEKHVLCFVMAAFLVGLAVKHYRQVPAAGEGVKTTSALTATPTARPAKKQKRHRKASPTPSSAGKTDGTGS